MSRVIRKAEVISIEEEDRLFLMIAGRRAIQAILRHSNGIALFKKDDQLANYWRLSAEEEPPKSMPSPEAEKTPVRRQPNNSTPSNSNNNALRRTRSRNGIAPRPLTKGSKLTLADLNELHVLITCAIEEKGDSATVNEINEFVVKGINDIRNEIKISIRETHKAIITLLTKSPLSSSLFMRDPTNYIRWKCTETHPWLGCSIEEKEQKLNETSDFILTSKELDFNYLSMEFQPQPPKEKVLSRR